MSIKKNIIYSSSYQILVILLPLITAPYISRVLGATSIGVYSYSYSIAYYFVLFCMSGMGNYGNRSIAYVRNNKDELERTFTELYSVQFILCTFFASIYFIYSFFLIEEHKTIALIQGLYILSSFLDISWLYFGLEEFKITVSRNFVIKVLTAIAIFSFVKEENDLTIYVLIISLGSLFSQAYLWHEFKKKSIKFHLILNNKIIKHFKPVFILFIPIISFSIYKILSKILLGRLSGYESLGFFENAEKIIMIPLSFITALGTVLMPRISNLVSTGNEEKAMEYLRTSYKIVSILSYGLVFGLLGISHLFTPLFFGEEFSKSAPLIDIMSFSVIFIAYSNIIRTQYLIPYKKDSIYIKSVIIGAAINLALNLLLIPKIGMYGAAISATSAEFSVMFFQHYLCGKDIKLSELIKSNSPYFIIASLMGVILRYFTHHSSTIFSNLVLYIALGFIFYLSSVIAYSYNFDKKTWLTIKNILKK